MKIQIESTLEKINYLIKLIESDPEIADLHQQLISAIAMENHHQQDEVPKVGDHPIVERVE